ncbi:response regulator [Desulfobulbus sp. TB]|nr:response regulator [Desulfobulbus sp. TB]
MSRKNILIVDRDKNFLLELRENFTPFKNVYQLAFVSTLAKAHEILQNFTVHMVIANVHLAGESGVDLLLWIRRWHAETYVVLYSSELTEEIKRAAYHSGVSGILPYPFRFEDLLKVLTGIFTKKSGNATFLDTIPLVDLLQLIGMGHHSTDIIVINKKKERGIIRINQGNLLEAEAAGQQGVNAVTEMLSWESPKIKTSQKGYGIPSTDPPVPLHDALIQAAAKLDEKS